MKTASKSVLYASSAALAFAVGACSSDSGTGVIPPGDAVLSGTITSDRTLYRDTTYTLQGYVKVANGATLTIQSGTKIVGDFETPGSSLWILRGARINAVGTVDQPIVFTSEKPVGERKPADWGGIIIVGRGVLNRNVSPIFTEGPNEASQDYSAGTNNADNSGILKYVRIEFAGYDVSGSGQELNSLSMYAVGNGTTIEYVQTVAGLDDAFEWFGGAVDGRFLVSYETGDDHFDWTEGYIGRNQFLIAFQSRRLDLNPGRGNYASDPRGFEGDNCDKALNGCSFVNNPRSTPVFANFTVIGPGTGVFGTADANASGMVVRRGSGGYFINGVIGRWPAAGITLIDPETDAIRASDSLMVRNVTLVENATTFAAGITQSLNIPANNITAAVGTTASLFTSLTPASLDLTPAVGASIRTSGTTTLPTRIAARASGFFGGTLQGTNYQGASDPAAVSKWWTGWTVYVTN